MENSDFTASVFFGVLHPERRTLEYSNAGHPPAALLQLDGSVEYLRTGDLLLGLPEAGPRTSAQVSLAKAKALFCYTDGLIEASRYVLEDEARLHEAIKNLPRSGVTTPAAHLLEEVLQTPAADDIAILAVTLEND